MTLKCPDCHCSDVKILNTQEKGDSVHVTGKCKSCGNKWETTKSKDEIEE